MTFWLALRRLLPLLAVLSLALTPVAAPAAAAGMHASMVHSGAAHDMMGHRHAEMADMAYTADMAMSMDQAAVDMDDMPCCPKAETPAADHHGADCAKGCPLMALCLASVASVLPSAVAIPVPAAKRASAAWPDPVRFVSVHGNPSPEPPRA